MHLKLIRSLFPCPHRLQHLCGRRADATLELVSIGSKPSARHVFFVDDFDAFKKIEDELITFVRETASASGSLKFALRCLEG